MQVVSSYGNRIVLGNNDTYVNSPPLFVQSLYSYGQLPLVKYYSFGGSDVCLYVHVSVCPYVLTYVQTYKGPFQRQCQLVYSSILPPLHHT